MSRQVDSGFRSPVVGVKGEETWSRPAWQQHGKQRQPMWQEQKVEPDMWVLWVVINVWVFILKTMRHYGEVFRRQNWQNELLHLQNIWSYVGPSEQKNTCHFFFMPVLSPSVPFSNIFSGSPILYCESGVQGSQPKRQSFISRFIIHFTIPTYCLSPPPHAHFMLCIWKPHSFL